MSQWWVTQQAEAPGLETLETVSDDNNSLPSEMKNESQQAKTVDDMLLYELTSPMTTLRTSK